MNKQRILELADFIEHVEERTNCELHFNMAYYAAPSAHSCGSVACIAGSAVFLYNRKHFDISAGYTELPLDSPNIPQTHNEAMELLELSVAQAGELFTPYIPLMRITKSEAVNTLRKLAETGVVDWSPVEKRLYGEGYAS